MWNRQLRPFSHWSAPGEALSLRLWAPQWCSTGIPRRAQVLIVPADGSVAADTHSQLSSRCRPRASALPAQGHAPSAGTAPSQWLVLLLQGRRISWGLCCAHITASLCLGPIRTAIPPKNSCMQFQSQSLFPGEPALPQILLKQLKYIRTW